MLSPRTRPPAPTHARAIAVMLDCAGYEIASADEHAAAGEIEAEGVARALVIMLQEDLNTLLASRAAFLKELSLPSGRMAGARTSSTPGQGSHAAAERHSRDSLQAAS